MNRFLFYYNEKLKQLSKKKGDSCWDYLKFLFYFFNYYGIKNFVFLIGIAIILHLFPGNLVNNFNTFMITGLSAYLLHRLAHESAFYGRISGHDFHHMDTKNLKEKAMEFFSDMFASGGFLLIVNIILNLNCIYLFDNYAILLFMFGFPMVHFVNYHWLIPESYHHYHHKEPKTNYSPDFYDHIFGTNLGDYFEDNSHMLPVFIIIGLIVYQLSKRKVFERYIEHLHKTLKYNLERCRAQMPNMTNWKASYQ